MYIQGYVGQPNNLSIGPNAPFTLRGGQMADLIVSELQGRFYENTYRGNTYSYGLATTALTANTITLTSTTTPILGIWNPTTSTINAVILQASLNCFPNNLTSGAGPGAFVWATSIGNGAITTGNNPFNRKTLASAGSQVKAFGGATALTGLTNNLVIFEGADFNNLTGLTYTTLPATALYSSAQSTQNFDGSIIVPPGGVLALLNTTSSTTFSVAGRMTWDEVPL
jgi:hypothetical protein